MPPNSQPILFGYFHLSIGILRPTIQLYRKPPTNSTENQQPTLPKTTLPPPEHVDVRRRPPPNVTVLLGTSMTKRIPERPGLVNLSTSGARLVSPHKNWKGGTALEVLDKFKMSEPGVSVKNIIVAYGTIRYAKGKHGALANLEYLGIELRRVIESARDMFESPRIFLATLIPLRHVFGSRPRML